MQQGAAPVLIDRSERGGIYGRCGLCGAPVTFIHHPRQGAWTFCHGETPLLSGWVNNKMTQDVTLIEVLYGYHGWAPPV